MVGNMCVDVFSLYLLGFKGMDGKGIREVEEAEFVSRCRDFAMGYQHYTPVPKGWKIPDRDRPYISAFDLSELEKGIKDVRARMGEREALED